MNRAAPHREMGRVPARPAPASYARVIGGDAMMRIALALRPPMGRSWDMRLNHRKGGRAIGAGRSRPTDSDRARRPGVVRGDGGGRAAVESAALQPS